MSPQARCTALEHFDRYLKPNFLPAKYAADEDGGEEEGFDKAYYCPVPGIPNDQKNGVHGGFLVLTSEDMEAIFQPSFREITRLVQGQICASEVRSQKSITVRIGKFWGLAGADVWRANFPFNSQGTICPVLLTNSLQGVLLVGGYGGSEYLRRHLADVLENNEHGKVNVLQPVNA